MLKKLSKEENPNLLPPITIILWQLMNSTRNDPILSVSFLPCPGECARKKSERLISWYRAWGLVFALSTYDICCKYLNRFQAWTFICRCVAQWQHRWMELSKTKQGRSLMDLYELRHLTFPWRYKVRKCECKSASIRAISYRAQTSIPIPKETPSIFSTPHILSVSHFTCHAIFKYSFTYVSLIYMSENAPAINVLHF